MIYVGIDISKLTFDVCKNGSHFQFSNDKKGFKGFRKLLNPQTDWCVMEASGPYCQQLASYLYAEDIKVSVVNPLVIKRFCQMRLIRAKTDKKDAAMIADYGNTEHPSAWEPDPAYLIELKQMHTLVNQLDKSRTGLVRQLESFQHAIFLSQSVKKTLVKTINDLEKQIAQIEKEMENLIKKYHPEMFDQIISIPGIGKKTSLFLIVITGGFTKFESAKQLSSYVGLSPRIYESGTSVKGRSRITKMGMSRIRAMLYVCTWSAIKCNKACKEIYERLLLKGKSKRLALIAVANKLIKQVFAVATKHVVYEEK